MVATGTAIINVLPMDFFCAPSSNRFINPKAIDKKIAHVGTLDIKADTNALVIINAKSIDSMLFPDLFKSASSMRLVTGTVVTAAEIPKEAIIKNITGCEKPLTAPAKSGVTPIIAVNPIVRKHVTEGGKASVTNRIRKNNTIPIVFMPSVVKPSGAGIISVKNRTKTARHIPANCFFII
jgi:hypothetical protein